jgi:predicted  nucleic acid-binding Zn-ribbon protein
MIKELKILVKMQECDDIIGEKEILTKQLPEELNNLKQNLETANNNLAETENALEENLKTQKLKELDIKANNEKIEKYKNQLLTIKTNKEYKALNSEVSHLENKNSETDDELIVLMEEEVNIIALLEIDKKEQKKADNELKANEEKLRKKIEDVEKDIAEYRNKRNILAKELNPQLVRRYALLIKNKNRKAVVFSDNNACGGCGYNIRPQLIIEINEGQKIINCENCGRLLVSKPA